MRSVRALLGPDASCVIPTPDSTERWDDVIRGQALYDGLETTCAHHFLVVSFTHDVRRLDTFLKDGQSNTTDVDTLRSSLFRVCRSSERLYVQRWHGEFLSWLNARLEWCIEAAGSANTDECVQYEFPLALLYERTAVSMQVAGEAI